MKIVADSSVILDFMDGIVEDPHEVIRPYKLILLSPVALHEILRAYPKENHGSLVNHLSRELLPVPSLAHWIEASEIMRELYPHRQSQNIARMQNDIIIALAARDINAPVWSRDSDFELVCAHLGVGLVTS